jgi:hypothetical protein
MEVNRRDFLYLLSALAVAPPSSLASAQSSRSSISPRKGFDPSEREILGELCEQIFPKDEFPGAKELGAVNFLENILEKAHPEWWTPYHAGLKATDEASRELHKKSFNSLPFEEQTRLLQKMEQGSLPMTHWKEIQPSAFFQMIRDHTLQAVFSHPKYGGNKDKAAWKMIGYDDWWT